MVDWSEFETTQSTVYVRNTYVAGCCLYLFISTCVIEVAKKEHFRAM